MSTEVTELNTRARGWLRHLWDKATTPDDWSSSGEPHEWWDRNSSGPMCALPRFDLGESAYALPLMCEVTPAWREVYTRIAREFCERHMTFWAAIDALVLIGEDPNVDRYPPEWQIYIPERLRGAYAPPGWIGNGDERWGLNPDPIAADGNVFFRGFFNLLLSVYAYVSGDQRYHEPFEISGYMDRTWHGASVGWVRLALWRTVTQPKDASEHGGSGPSGNQSRRGGLGRRRKRGDNAHPRARRRAGASHVSALPAGRSAAGVACWPTMSTVRSTTNASDRYVRTPRLAIEDLRERRRHILVAAYREDAAAARPGQVASQDGVTLGGRVEQHVEPRQTAGHGARVAACVVDAVRHEDYAPLVARCAQLLLLGDGERELDVGQPSRLNRQQRIDDLLERRLLVEPHEHRGV